jgi:hypothetical protein
VQLPPQSRHYAYWSTVSTSSGIRLRPGQAPCRACSKRVAALLIPLVRDATRDRRGLTPRGGVRPRCDPHLPERANPPTRALRTAATGRLSRSGPVNRAVRFRYPGDVVIPARRGILASDRDLDHRGSRALVAVRAALRLVIRVGAGSAGKRPLISSRWRWEAVNPDAILNRATQIRCSVRSTRCFKSDYHPHRVGD